jgi:hypothetical protein
MHLRGSREPPNKRYCFPSIAFAMCLTDYAFKALNAYRMYDSLLVSLISNHRALPTSLATCPKRLFLARLLDALGTRVHGSLALTDLSG